MKNPTKLFCKIVNNKEYFEILLLIALFFCIIFIQIISFINPIINVDAAGYHLNVGRAAIRYGEVIYRDIFCPYTPLGILSNSSPYLFFNSPSYSLFLIPSIIAFWLNLFIFFGILKSFNLETKLSGIFSLFLGILLLNFEASFPLLELYVTLFAIFAFYLIRQNFLSNNTVYLFFAGVSTFLAVWSKQNGLFILVSFLLYFLVIYKFKIAIKKYLWILFGFCIPLILAIIYYSVILDNFSLSQLLHNIVFIDRSITVTGVGLNFRSVIMSLLYFFSRNIYFLFSIILFIKLHYKSKMLLANGLMALSSFVVLFQAHYHHYFILIIPFALLFSILIYFNSTYKIKKIFLICFFISFMLLMKPLIGNIINFNKISKQRNDLYQEASKLSEVVPKGSKVFLFGDPRFYLLCEYRSVIPQKIGYSFYLNCKLEYIFNQIDNGGIFIIESSLIDKFLKSSYRNAFKFQNRIMINDEKFYEFYFKMSN